MPIIPPVSMSTIKFDKWRSPIPKMYWQTDKHACVLAKCDLKVRNASGEAESCRKARLWKTRHRKTDKYCSNRESRANDKQLWGDGFSDSPTHLKNILPVFNQTYIHNFRPRDFLLLISYWLITWWAKLLNMDAGFFDQGHWQLFYPDWLSGKNSHFCLP